MEGGEMEPMMQSQYMNTQLPPPPPMARVAVDVNGDGIADVIVTGVDMNRDGIPDALQPGLPQPPPMPVVNPLVPTDSMPVQMEPTQHSSYTSSVPATTYSSIPATTVAAPMTGTSFPGMPTLGGTTNLLQAPVAATSASYSYPATTGFAAPGTTAYGGYSAPVTTTAAYGTPATTAYGGTSYTTGATSYTTGAQLGVTTSLAGMPTSGYYGYR